MTTRCPAATYEKDYRTKGYYTIDNGYVKQKKLKVKLLLSEIGLLWSTFKEVNGIYGDDQTLGRTKIEYKDMIVPTCLS